MRPVLTVGRYAVFGPIASGGMATVHFGRLLGAHGFSRTVAIKRLHPSLAQDAEVVPMFIDEAHLTSRIRHPNVVPTLDAVAHDGELMLVMEYVAGEALSKLVRLAGTQRTLVPPPVAAAIVAGVLQGLHAAHEAQDEAGERLAIVHRDVSPQNILVEETGLAKVTDFGIARALGRLQRTTRAGMVKGKPAYMAPEQLRSEGVDARTDVYAAAVVLWETLTGKRLFDADNDHALMLRVLGGAHDAPSRVEPSVPKALDEVVMRGLSVDPDDRYASAKDMAFAIEEAVPLASTGKVAAWMRSLAGPELDERAAAVRAMERATELAVVPSAAGGTASDDGPVGATKLSPETTEPSTRTAVAGNITASTARPATGRVSAALLLFALAAGGGVLTWRTLRGGAGPQPALGQGGETPEPSVSASSRPDAPSASVEAPPGQASAEPVAAVPVAPERAAQPGRGASAPRARAATPVSREPGPRASASAAPAAAKPGCDPPYTRDERGVVRYKRECLQ